MAVQIRKRSQAAGQQCKCQQCGNISRLLQDRRFVIAVRAMYQEDVRDHAMRLHFTSPAKQQKKKGNSPSMLTPSVATTLGEKQNEIIRQKYNGIQ